MSIAIFGFYTANKQLPYIAGWMVDSYPESVDKAVGQRATTALLKKYAMDERRTALLKAFYDQLGLDAETAIYVLKAPGYKIYGLPGNTIMVSDGSLDHIKTYPQLAALLAHEHAHIHERTGVIALTDTLLPQIFTAWITGKDQTRLLLDNAELLLVLPDKPSVEFLIDQLTVGILQHKQVDINGLAEQITLASSDSVPFDAMPGYATMHHADSLRIGMLKAQTAFTTNIYTEQTRLDSLYKELVK